MAAGGWGGGVVEEAGASRWMWLKGRGRDGGETDIGTRGDEFQLVMRGEVTRQPSPLFPLSGNRHKELPLCSVHDTPCVSGHMGQVVSESIQQKTGKICSSNAYRKVFDNLLIIFDPFSAPLERPGRHDELLSEFKTKSEETKLEQLILETSNDQSHDGDQIENEIDDRNIRNRKALPQHVGNSQTEGSRPRTELEPKVPKRKSKHQQKSRSATTSSATHAPNAKQNKNQQNKANPNAGTKETKHRYNPQPATETNLLFAQTPFASV